MRNEQEYDNWAKCLTEYYAEVERDRVLFQKMLDGEGVSNQNWRDSQARVEEAYTRRRKAEVAYWGF